MSLHLPNLSKAMDVAGWRYIQSIHELPERRNPDTLVRHFIPALKRWRMALSGRGQLTHLRANPFYYYLLARTMHYDDVFQSALSAGVRQIALIGCGTDTRAYRFEDALRRGSVRVLECDQPEAIRAKERLARRWRRFEHVQYLPIDLNDEVWPDLQQWLGDGAGLKSLVLMEGVSVYVNDVAFGRFLRLLATRLTAGSYLAYDYKVLGMNDQLGCAGRTQRPFRLSNEREEVAAFHRPLGLQLDSMEPSSELTARRVPGLATSRDHLFREDTLLRLHVTGD